MGALIMTLLINSITAFGSLDNVALIINATPENVQELALGMNPLCFASCSFVIYSFQV